MNRKHTNGFLIAIEGIDGAGKTTQAHLLEEGLKRRDFDVVCTKEPTDGKWGTLLRESARNGRLSPQDELKAFLEDRKEHVANFIWPKLDEGKVVIVDRYYFSTAAYQGARGMDPMQLIKMNEEFAPEPDLLVILDVDPDVGLHRIHARGDAANFFEIKAALEKSRNIFRAIEKPYVIHLDGKEKPAKIRDKILKRFLVAVRDRSIAAEQPSSCNKTEGVQPVTGSKAVNC